AADDRLAAANLGERQQRIEAERQKLISEAHFKLARVAVDSFHTKVSDSSEFKAYGLEPLRQKLLESAVDFYQRFVQEEADDPTIQVERGQAYRKLGSLYQSLGRHEQSGETRQQAVAIFQQLAEARPQETRYQRELAVSLSALG